MSAPVRLPAYTVLPSAPNRPELEWRHPQPHTAYPIKRAKFLHGEPVDSNGLDFSCINTSRHPEGSMQIYRRAPTCRMLPTPSFIFSTSATAEVLAQLMEDRALLWCRRKGSPQERITHAECVIKNRDLPRLEYRLYKMLTRKADPAQIEAIDTQIIIARRGTAEILLGIMYRSWRLGEDSVMVARALGLKPVGVRQILHGARRVAERIEKRKKKAAAGAAGLS